MTRWSAARLLLTIAISVLVWYAIARACLMVGSMGRIGPPTSEAVYDARWELVSLASLVGAALSAAGVVYQAILRNPLADPYLLGVSSGATLLAYLWTLPGITSWITYAPGQVIGQQVCAFVGALASVGIVFVLATRRGRLEPVTLLLVGVIVNAINGSIFILLNALVKEMPTPGGPMAFLVGGLQTNLVESDITVARVVIGAGFLVLLYLTGQINVAMLSDAEAQSLGVRIGRLRWIAMIAASLVTASAVAISGPIGFIGLVCPHLARLIVGNDQRKLLPLATALGASMLCIADASTRWLTPVAGTVLPVGVLTGLMGGPFFLMLLWQQQRRKQA